MQFCWVCIKEWLKTWRFSLISKRKICPVEDVQILEYTRFSVSVPKPLVVHLRTLGVWGASYNSRVECLVQIHLFIETFFEKRQACKCMLSGFFKVSLIFQTGKQRTELGYILIEPNVEEPTWWGCSLSSDTDMRRSPENHTTSMSLISLLNKEKLIVLTVNVFVFANLGCIYKSHSRVRVFNIIV